MTNEMQFFFQLNNFLFVGPQSRSLNGDQRSHVDNPQDIPKENCLTACENAAIRNCQYSNDGECTFELKNVCLFK